VVPAGTVLVPRAVASPRFFSRVLAPGEELEAALIVDGTALSQPLLVARAFYRNDASGPQEVTLAVLTTRERGIEAELIVGESRLPQWRFALVGAET
jgi:hypothetical protein